MSDRLSEDVHQEKDRDDLILTHRVRLRQLGLFTDESVRRYIGGAKTETDARSLASPLDGAWGHFVVADVTSDRMLGTLHFDQKRGPWEVSFQLCRSEWGKGLMREALTAAHDWFFSVNDANQFIAVTQVANERTQRLLERVGAVLPRVSSS